MEKRTDGQCYVVEILCNSLHVSFPLNDIIKILSKKDLKQSQDHNNSVIYQEREFLVFSLSKLFRCPNIENEKYALLIQNEDIEAILYIEEVEGIRALDDNLYDLPTYLKKTSMDYIINCHMSGSGCLAFQIDFVKLLKRYHNT